jgi:hypothetical protein
LLHWLWVGSAQATFDGRTKEPTQTEANSPPSPGAATVGELPRNSTSSRQATDSSKAVPLGQPLSVVVTLVGDAATESTLFERIRTLLPRDAHAVLRVEERLLRDAVLQPATEGVVYAWILRSDANAGRVYLALREHAETEARFLFREVRLENGLDEVGIETLAQVAHSSVEALWGAAQQITRRELAVELERDELPRARAPENAASAPPDAAASAERRDLPKQLSHNPADTPKWQLEFGPQFSLHQSGSEGWLAYPGGVVALSFSARVGLRGNFGILLPAHFDAAATRIALSGYTGDVRLGCGSMRRDAWNWRAEAGVGATVMRWTTADIDAGVVSRPSADQRGYAVLSVAAGRASTWTTIGVRFDAIAPFQKTTYEIGTPTQNVVVGRSWLTLAGAVEMTFPVTRF